MKSLLLVIILLIPVLSFGAQTEVQDTAYTLLDYHNEEMVNGDSVKLLPIPQSPRKNVRRQIQPSDLEAHNVHDYGRPYDSTQHLNPTLSALISLSFFVFVTYVAVRVWLGLRKDKQRDGRTKS